MRPRMAKMRPKIAKIRPKRAKMRLQIAKRRPKIMDMCKGGKRERCISLGTFPVVARTYIYMYAYRGSFFGVAPPIYTRVCIYAFGSERSLGTFPVAARPR